MRIRSGLVVLIALAVIVCPTRFVVSHAQVAPPTSNQDQQSVAVLSKALSVAGGSSSIASLQDLVATGQITYNQSENVTEGVKIRSRGIGDYRIDLTQSGSVRSEVTTNGQTTVSMPDGTAAAMVGQAPVCPSRLIFPYFVVSAAIIDPPGFNLAYKGIVEIDGHSAYDIGLEQVLPGLSGVDNQLRKYLTLEIFVDTSTLLVSMIRDTVPANVTREFRYSDYRSLNGILVPFSIGQQSNGLAASLISLDQVAFNSGLQDSDFSF